MDRGGVGLRVYLIAYRLRLYIVLAVDSTRDARGTS